MGESAACMLLNNNNEQVLPSLAGVLFNLPQTNPGGCHTGYMTKFCFVSLSILDLAHVLCTTILGQEAQHGAHAHVCPWSWAATHALSFTQATGTSHLARQRCLPCATQGVILCQNRCQIWKWPPIEGCRLLSVVTLCFLRIPALACKSGVRITGVGYSSRVGQDTGPLCRITLIE